MTLEEMKKNIFRAICTEHFDYNKYYDDKRYICGLYSEASEKYEIAMKNVKVKKRDYCTQANICFSKIAKIAKEYHCELYVPDKWSDSPFQFNKDFRIFLTAYGDISVKEKINELEKYSR